MKVLHVAGSRWRAIDKQWNFTGHLIEIIQREIHPRASCDGHEVYDRIGYGLVMEATSDIHVLDGVRNPT